MCFFPVLVLFLFLFSFWFLLHVRMRFVTIIGHRKKTFYCNSYDECLSFFALLRSYTIQHQCTHRIRNRAGKFLRWLILRASSINTSLQILFTHTMSTRTSTSKRTVLNYIENATNSWAVKYSLNVCMGFKVIMLSQLDVHTRKLI